MYRHTSRMLLTLAVAALITGCSTQDLPLIDSLQKTTTTLMQTITAWWYKTPKIVQELDASQMLRETEFTQAYLTSGIPEPIARIAGRVDRMIQDTTAISTELKTLPAEERAPFIEEENNRSLEMVKFLREQDDVLQEFTEKAVYKKDLKLYKFVNVLRTRAFLFE
jgi:hypothetical protein